MLVIAAPGQGAQTPGFLSPWLEIPGVADWLAAWSDLAGCDLIKYGTLGTADEIRDTAVAQPLLVGAALAAARTMGIGSPAADGRVIAAGHSVGELAAGAIAGVLSSQDAVRLVGVRGRAMADAAAATHTSMTAVLGGDEGAVLRSIEANGLTPANINAAGQIVAAGTAEQLAAFAADPPAGARLRPLQVAGAFHTVHMAPAVDALRAAAATVAVADPTLKLLSNRDGAAVQDRFRLARADLRSGQRAGALGQLHGHDDQPRRVGLHRTPSGGHAGGSGKESYVRDQDTRGEDTR